MGRERSLAAEQRAEQRVELRLGRVTVSQMHRHVEVDAPLAVGGQLAGQRRSEIVGAADFVRRRTYAPDA